MLKPIRWSSFAENDLAKLLEYLDSKWNTSVCLKFINELDFCTSIIQQKPEQFPVFNKELQIRKCVITKQNSLYYKETSTRIEILRLYDTRQNPENLLF